MAMVNLDTKELSGMGMIIKKKVDSEKFLKIYEDGVKSMMNLSSYGMKMFRFIFTASGRAIDKDKIYLSYTLPEINEEMAKTTYTRGIKDLIGKGFLAPCVEVGFYWINPAYIFNGNRLTMVKQYELEDRSKRKIKNYAMKNAKPEKHQAEQFNLPYTESSPFEENGSE